MKVSTRRIFWAYGGTIAFAVVVALFIRFFVIEAYRIPTFSMKPTLEPGDTIFVAKWPFGFRIPGFGLVAALRRPPARSEIVVFSLPNDPNRDYIKRVIALPGETVEIRKGRLTIDQKPLKTEIPRNSPCGKEWLPEGQSYEVCWEPPLIEGYGPEKVPPDAVFLLGDYRTQNTNETKKQRSWGIIPVALLKGKALWIWLSVDPHSYGNLAGWFPRFRFDRMLRRIE